MLTALVANLSIDLHKAIGKQCCFHQCYATPNELMNWRPSFNAYYKCKYDRILCLFTQACFPITWCCCASKVSPELRVSVWILDRSRAKYKFKLRTTNYDAWFQPLICYLFASVPLMTIGAADEIGRWAAFTKYSCIAQHGDAEHEQCNHTTDDQNLEMRNFA